MRRLARSLKLLASELCRYCDARAGQQSALFGNIVNTFQRGDVHIEAAGDAIQRIAALHAVAARVSRLRCAGFASFGGDHSDLRGGSFANDEPLTHHDATFPQVQACNDFADTP